MVEIDLNKICKSCSKNLPIDSYYKSSNTKAYPDNRINLCKTCMKKYKKEKKIKEKIVFKVINKEFTINFD
jgi:hypothetical protein